MKSKLLTCALHRPPREFHSNSNILPVSSLVQNSPATLNKLRAQSLPPAPLPGSAGPPPSCPKAPLDPFDCYSSANPPWLPEGWVRFLLMCCHSIQHDSTYSTDHTVLKLSGHLSLSPSRH
uniref:Uncharacterized protein n=1 Tax=Molossus molossus TaxID=27622 RepID=A0A7J8FAK5_MOLMO|nr:hypothetical protein HJG59_008547 [Molossus molossus]